MKKLTKTQTAQGQDSATEAALYMALELSAQQWKLALSDGRQKSERIVNVAAGDLRGVQQECTKAKEKFGLPATAAVYSCYEAGRDGFWVQRALQRQGVTNLVVDPASIEVPRRLRRCKTDLLDARKLLGMLLRYRRGEEGVWRVVRVPSAAEEDGRRLHREREVLLRERTRLGNRVRGLLAQEGVRATPSGKLLAQLEQLRTWEGQPLPVWLRDSVRRELARWQLVEQQLRELEAEQRRQAQAGETKSMAQVRQLQRLRGVGLQSAWLLVQEFFGWRAFRNGKEVGALAGLTGTPYNSGARQREQGISKAGNPRVRTLSVELAWLWLQYQPGSELSKWFHARFGGGKRLRRVGIVAVARRLLVALWRYLDQGEAPAGAVLVDG
ncbi:MAG: IS110 family transposase [Chloroflexota bacterium]